MHEDLNTHYRETLNSATNLLSVTFKKQIHFSKVTQLSEPDRRNVILRLQIDNPISGMPQTLILKKNSIEKQIFDKSESETEVEQTTRFARDWAGIEFLTQVGGDHAPRFYAGSMEHRFIIIEDLGLEHPSLVGPLTREFSNTNLQQAKVALIAYVRRLGKMHAATMGKLDQFSAIIKRIYPQAIRFSYIPEIDRIINILKQLIGNNSKELIREVQSVLEFPQSPNEFQVLLHGDICPDNVYYASGNMRFIDFEFGDFGNALIDGVYLRMHMPSCWCSKAVSMSIVSEMESIYREELTKNIKSAADEDTYTSQLVYACAYWLIRTIEQLEQMDLLDHEWICPSGPVDADSKWQPEKNAFRPRVISRLTAFITCPGASNRLPNLWEAAVQLLAHLRKIWPETEEIDLYPVFKADDRMI